MRKLALIALALILFSSPALAKQLGQEIKYKVGETELTGYLVKGSDNKNKRPGVLVVHEWWGHNAYARKRAEMLGKLGYNAFAVDMYGTGKVANHPKDAKGFMMSLMSDTKKIESRFAAAMEVLKKDASTDPSKIAAIGYCMGGAIILHAARTGVDLKAVASFHGSLGAKAKAGKGSIKPEILVMTGGADPFVPTKSLDAFKKEMDEVGANYSVVVYDGAKHGFTNPEADTFGDKFKIPLAYDKKADEDSWAKMKALFEKAFK